MLLFDFDGVLIDSLDEVIVTAYSAVAGHTVKSLREVPERFTILFRSNRYHVQPAADLITLARWCLDQSSSDSETQLSRSLYASLLCSEKESLDQRRELFFGTRAKVIAAGKENWLALNRPYPVLFSALRQEPPSRILIVTNKNRSAVRELCTHFGLTLDERNIYSGDAGATKESNLVAIESRFPTEKLCFLEDSVHNLLELRHHPRLTGVLASWGYLGPEDAALARAHHIRVYTQEEVVALLKENHLLKQPTS